jgi:pentatricopeptide repeat protein
MKQQKIIPNWRIYGCVVNSYVKQNNISEALKTVQDMWTQGINTPYNPDFVYLSLFKGLMSKDELVSSDFSVVFSYFFTTSKTSRMAESFVLELVSKRTKCPLLYGLYIDYLLKKRSIHECLRFIKESAVKCMDDVVTMSMWESLMHSLLLRNRCDDMEFVLDTMSQNGDSMPSVKCYSMLVDALCRRDSVPEAWDYLKVCTQL